MSCKIKNKSCVLTMMRWSNNVSPCFNISNPIVFSPNWAVSFNPLSLLPALREGFSLHRGNFKYSKIKIVVFKGKESFIFYAKTTNYSMREKPILQLQLVMKSDLPFLEELFSRKLVQMLKRLAESQSIGASLDLQSPSR